MGQISSPEPVLLLLVAFSRHAAALDWARCRAVEAFGPVAAESERFCFEETDYYQPSMGPGLQKTFFAFQKLVDPARLPQIKRQTNDWEQAYAREAAHAEPRPLNLDPGYLTLAKLVLASTKDHAHRIYVGEGIFAEVTLQYRHRRWQALEWTFPDYRREDYQQSLTQFRELYRSLRVAAVD